MRKLFLIILACIVAATTTLAFTDPEPNPFATLKESENVYAGVITAVDATTLTVKNPEGKEFSAHFTDIFKYRDGASVPDSREFSVGDRVRYIGTTAGVLIVVQDSDLVLSGVEIAGRVQKVAAGELVLQSVDHETYRVVIDAGTAYFDSPGKQKMGVLLAVGDALKVHGVRNSRTKTVYVLTRDTYITLLSADQLTSLIAAAATQEQAAIATAAASFPDVTTDYPYRTAVGFVKSAGFVNGYADGTFGPAKSINRAELAKLLIAARFSKELPEKVTTACFTDVSPEAWFARFVCTAKHKSIIGGNPDGTFAPADGVNLAAGIKIVLGAFGVAVTPAGSGEAWYAPYIAKARAQELIPAAWADPAKPLTRGEVAEMIYRAAMRERNDTMTQ